MIRPKDDATQCAFRLAQLTREVTIMEYNDYPENTPSPSAPQSGIFALLRKTFLRRSVVVIGVIGVGAWAVLAHPPLQTVERGDVGVRVNQWSGSTENFQEGPVLVIPGIHELRTFSLRDLVYHPDDAQFQSIEGLSLGVDFTVRYALDPDQIAVARRLPENISDEVVLPIVQDVFHRTLSRFTVREIFSARRDEIQNNISEELRTRLATDGIKLKLLTIGKVDLPQDYKVGMEKMLAAELATEQMKYTLELKEKEIKESELRAEAERVRRAKEAETAAQEQIIAAQAQAEAMKHILPFKEKQIRQRELEAEAAKVARIRSAQGDAEARKIEAAAEAESRRTLADAEAYRLEQVGKANSDQLAREGAILAQSPLLIQKSLADKLSDKIQVIIAPPAANGGFLGENLIGRVQAPAQTRATSYARHETDDEDENEE
ncbi:MAG: prohibitin family protein [Azoarcus sp.]|jgi:regulator of protease activity HflC (stomatin/prohibitin superfamily)|nr:prohibitin family protein [Azoarcus sp.]